MKKLVTILMFFVSFNLYSQNTVPDSLLGWNSNGNFALQFNNSIFSNWAKGGESTIATSFLFDYELDYVAKKYIFENTLNLGYALIYSDEFDIRKTDDKIDFISKYGLNLTDKLNATALLNFKTQFAEGFKYPNDSTVISNFLAPGYLNLSIGIDYKPKKDVSMFFTPLSGRIIFVFDQDLADAGQYGVKKAVRDSLDHITTEGENIKYEFGANMVTKYKTKLFENTSFNSKLELFMNYTDQIAENRANIDVNWESTINLKINSWLSVNMFFHLLYDHDILVPLDKNNPDKKGRRLQYKNTNGLAISVKF